MLASISILITGLIASAGAVIASSAFKGKSLDFGNLQKALRKLLNPSMNALSPSAIDDISNQVNSLIRTLRNYKNIYIDQDKANIAKLFFPNEINELQSLSNNFNNLSSNYINLLNRLSNEMTNNKLFSTGQIGTFGDTFISSTKNTDTIRGANLQTILNLLEQMGIINSSNMSTKKLDDILLTINYIPSSTTVMSIDDIINLINKGTDISSNIISKIDELYNQSIYLITTITASPTVSLPGITNTLTDDEIENLIGIGTLSEQLLRYMLMSITRTRTKTKTKTKTRKKKKWKKRRRSKKKRKKLPPKKIKRAWINTSGKSRWIEKVVFEFPAPKDLESDDKGTIYFHLKKSGTVIRFVRVKRGTFSVISQTYGTGYRVWSQFWKKRIVNRTVLSWFLKRINQADREIGIAQEINDKKVKYK